MSTAKASSKKRRTEPQLAKSDHLDLDLSNDIKGIMSALHQIREKAHKDGLKKNEETVSRQSFAKSLSKSSKEVCRRRRKECENCLKTETAKFQAQYLQALKDFISNYEEEKERLCTRYEQLRKKERSLISEHEKACTDKIAKLEESLKKKKQDDRTFSSLRKTLGSFLKNLFYVWGKLHFPDADDARFFVKL
ncbi:PREDICTED: uncharacterized protein LOC103324190 [Prunus mume]|uniref:Uncharacterized protein LOC103324190 n=1 Tax=Prunus mume TaxID=102107 RepID=A0ABM0NGH3_PRUMU|nr:PREDICTED: uncharacterized protein LOC103324190 [Prunus mume]